MSSNPSSNTSQRTDTDKRCVELTKDGNLLQEILMNDFSSTDNFRPFQSEVTDNMKIAGSSSTQISRSCEEKCTQRLNVSMCYSKGSKNLHRHNETLGGPPISPFLVDCRSCRSENVTYDATCQECKTHYKTPLNQGDSVKKMIQVEIIEMQSMSPEIDFLPAAEETDARHGGNGFDIVSTKTAKYSQERRVKRGRERQEVTTFFKEFVQERERNVGLQGKDLKTHTKELSELSQKRTGMDSRKNSESKILFDEHKGQRAEKDRCTFHRKDARNVSDKLEASNPKRNGRDVHKRQDKNGCFRESTERHGCFGNSRADSSSHRRCRAHRSEKKSSPHCPYDRIRIAEERICDCHHGSHLRSRSRRRRSPSSDIRKNHYYNDERRRNKLEEKDVYLIGRDSQDHIKVPKYEQSATASQTPKRTGLRGQNYRPLRDHVLPWRRRTLPCLIRPFNDRCDRCLIKPSQPRNPSVHMFSYSRLSSRSRSARSCKNLSVNDNENDRKRRYGERDEGAKEKSRSFVSDLRNTLSEKLSGSPWTYRQTSKTYSRRDDSPTNEERHLGRITPFRHRRYVSDTEEDIDKNKKAGILLKGKRQSKKIKCKRQSKKVYASTNEKVSKVKVPASTKANQFELSAPKTKSETKDFEVISSLSLIDLRFIDQIEVHGSHSVNAGIQENFNITAEKKDFQNQNRIQSRNTENAFGLLKEMFITRTLAKMIGGLPHLGRHHFRLHVVDYLRVQLARANISRFRLRIDESEYRYLNCINLPSGCDVSGAMTHLRDPEKCRLAGRLSLNKTSFDMAETSQNLLVEREIIPRKCQLVDKQKIGDFSCPTTMCSESTDSFLSDVELDKVNILEMTEEFCDIVPILSPLTINVSHDGDNADHCNQFETADNTEKPAGIYGKEIAEEGSDISFKTPNPDCTCERNCKIQLEDPTITKMVVEDSDISELCYVNMEPYNTNSCCPLPSETTITMIPNSDVHFDRNNSNDEKKEAIPKRAEETKPSTSKSFDDDHETGEFYYQYDNLQSPIVLNSHDCVYHISDKSSANEQQNTDTITSSYLDSANEVSEILGHVRHCDDILATAMESAGLSEAAVENFLDIRFDLDSVIFGGDTMSQHCESLHTEESVDQLFFKSVLPEDATTLSRTWNTHLQGIEDNKNLTQSNFLTEPFSGNDLSAVEFDTSSDLEFCESYCQERGHDIFSSRVKHVNNNNTKARYCVTGSISKRNVIQMNSVSVPHSDISGESEYTSEEFAEKEREAEDILLVTQLNNGTDKKGATRQAQTVIARRLEFTGKNDIVPKRRVLRKSRSRAQQPRRLLQKNITDKLKCDEEVKDATVKPVSAENHVGNKTQLTPMEKFRRPRTMLRRQLRSMSGRNVNASLAGTKLVNSNNNSDSPGSSGTDMSCQQPGRSSSATEGTDQKREELVSRLKARCRELDKHYKKRYQSPEVTTFSSSILPNPVSFSSDSQHSNMTQGNKSTRGKNIEKRSANSGENTVHSDTKLKNSMLNFVKRIQSGYGDQFPVSNQTTKEKRREICNRYLVHHGVSPADIQHIKETDQKQRPRGKRNTSNCESSFGTILNQRNETLHTIQSSQEVSSRTNKEDKTDSAQCSDGAEATTSYTSVSIEERLKRIEGDCTQHNSFRMGPGRRPTHNRPKSSSETNINMIRSSTAAACSKPSTSTSTSRLTARPLSPGRNLLMKIDKFERDFQAKFSTFYTRASSDKESMHDSIRPETRHSIKRVRGQLTIDKSNAQQRKKLLKILHKFENLEFCHETSDQASDLKPGSIQNLSQIHIKHGTVEEAKLGGTTKKSSLLFQNELVYSADSQEDSMQESEKKRNSISSDNRKPAGKIRPEVDDMSNEDDRGKAEDQECMQNMSAYDLIISHAVRDGTDDVAERASVISETKKSLKQCDLPSLEIQKIRPTLENQALSFSTGTTSRAEINDIKLPPLSNRDVITIPGSKLIDEKEMYALLTDTTNVANCHSPGFRPNTFSAPEEKDLSPTDGAELSDSVGKLMVIDVSERLISSIQKENSRADTETEASSLPNQNHQSDDISALCREDLRNIAEPEASFHQVAADGDLKEDKSSDDEIAESGMELNVVRSFNDCQENPWLPPRLHSGKCTLLSPIPEDSDEELVYDL